MEELKRIKVGTRVSTPDGEGVVVGIEPIFKKVRYPVKLDDETRYWYSPAYYWFDEVVAV